MIRCIHILVAILVVAGCSRAPDHAAPSHTESFTIDEATIVDFFKRTGRIDAQLEPRVPPAAALTRMNEGDERLAVIIWKPEKVGKSLGLRDRDRIALIDGEDVSKRFGASWQDIGKHKKASAFGTHKYTHFITRLFTHRDKADAVELLVYRPSGDTLGSPFLLHIEFTD